MLYTTGNEQIGADYADIAAAAAAAAAVVVVVGMVAK